MSDEQPIDLDDLQRVAVLARERYGDNWLADMIELAGEEIARLRDERRWIPVTERLPPVQGEEVLVAQGPWDDGSYSLDSGWWNGTQWMFYRGAWDTPHVAFWQPLPRPPGKEVEG